MSDSKFTDYQVDHLFLLIGENPLPNYVAARLLLQQGGTPYLVYTTGTERPAQRLQRILDNELTGFQKAQLVPLEEYESDAHQIQTRIQKVVKDLNGQVGLNYTGGTKAMAVHAYRAMFKEKGQEAVFSYLDPRRLEMCVDQEMGESLKIPIRSEDVTISLSTLFELHGLKWKDNKQPAKAPTLLDLATRLAEAHQDSAKGKAWFHWFYSIFCEGDGDSNQAARKPKKAGGKPGNWKSKTDLKGLSFPTICLPKEIVEGLRQKEFLNQDDYLSLELVERHQDFKDLQDFCKWLDGTWLEHYLLGQIQSIAKKAGISDYGLNFEVPLAGTQEGFEFDVAFTYGYQLFAISCTTTADRGLCKSKLFEAYLRSQQLGGSEARVALFSFNDDLGGLASEMGNLLSQKQIRLFGRHHVANFANEVIGWIRDNDAEAGR
ncbi:DUF1887 family protein [Leptothermofonsia sichuanensis E412]|uniref:Card1-like endonuclease domain-containing protein n=1 Tax=Leptothermofonsia sichuanensis TaxID=2917832 RepID=UPI001CA78042|nr:DUF1887 family CARF protein [Leptothermofonsia sichuanensis]QZZ22903.1 DUF1887 family protein [Leptothermofonsia sichuanensis E412]